MYKITFITPIGERKFETKGIRTMLQVIELLKSSSLELVPGAKIEISLDSLGECPTCGKPLDGDQERDYGGCPDCFSV